MSLLEARGLHCGYGAVAVLHDVSLHVGAGEIVAVLGANGAGKTTLLRALSGLLAPTAGTVTLDGRNLAAVRVEDRVRLGVAHVPQGRGVVEELTVAENLRLGGLWRTGRAARAEQAQALRQVYELFEPLARRRDLAAHHLSGGERQMLAIGRALVAKPRLLLLDEPSLGLAPRLVGELMALLRDLRDRTGQAVLLVEQNARAALDIADTAVVLALGRVARTADASALRDPDVLRATFLGG